MSNHTYFDIMPFDPMVIPNPKIALPFDWEDFQHQLQIICPDSEIRTEITDGEKYLDLFITLEQDEPWAVAHFLGSYNVFMISLWPKRLAKEILLWYRRYIPPSYRLFSVIEEYGEVTELPVDITSDDIEKLYPYFVPED